MNLQELKKLKKDFYLKNKFNNPLAAVKVDGDALRFVKDQTNEICLAAVKQDGNALRYVKDQTNEICLGAVKVNGLALAYVADQTPEICLAAVEQNGNALQYVEDQIFDGLTTELTVAEISEILGFEVKIVK